MGPLGCIQFVGRRRGVAGKPSRLVVIIQRFPIGEFPNKLFVSLAPITIASVGRAEFRVWDVSTVLLDLPDVPVRQTPVVSPQGAQVANGVADDPARVVDVWIEVAVHEPSNGSEDGFPAEEAGVARLGDCAPQAGPPAPVKVNDVVEIIFRFEVQNERRIPMLLEYGRSCDHGLQAMGASSSDNAAKGPERFWLLLVVD